MSSGAEMEKPRTSVRHFLLKCAVVAGVYIAIFLIKVRSCGEKIKKWKKSAI